MLEIRPLWETDAQLGQVAAGTSQQADEGKKETTNSPGDSWRVVGKDDFTGRLLVTCKSTSTVDRSYDNVRTEAEDAISTKIAVIDLNTKKLDVLFTCDTFYDILQCSVDQNLQRLAFICRTVPCENVQIQNSSFDSSVHDVECEEIAYMCYWTLLNSNANQLNTMHPLNKESFNFMKVQFLSLTQLLVFNPREAIYMYTLPSEDDLSRCGLSLPVLYERLAGPFLWAEWNIPARQIFYLHLRCRPQTSHHHLESSCSSTDTESAGNSQTCDRFPSLVGLQIHPGSPFETVLSIPLDMLKPFKQGVLDAVVETPDVHRNSGPSSNKIYDPSVEIDLSVFTQPQGVVYICQGITKEQSVGNSNALMLESITHDIDINIKYSVTMLHHGCTLHCSVQSKTLSNAVNRQLVFTPLHGYILVFVPGVFTHLLDVGMEHEPCNHVLCLGCELPPVNVKECAEFLSAEYSSANDALTYIIHSAENLKLFSVNITSNSLLAAFQQQSSRPSSSLNLVRQSILHHLLVHYDHYSNVEMAFKDLVHDATHPHLAKLLQEFLVGGAFALAKGRVNEKILSLLPVSIAEPFHPQQEMFLDDEVQMTITYAKLKDASSVLLSPNERHLPSRKMRDLWFRLWNHLRSSAPAAELSRRFSSKAMRDRLLVLGSPPVLHSKLPSASPSSNPFTFPIPLESISSLAQENSSNSVASFCNRFLGAAAKFRKAFSGAKHKMHKGTSSKGGCADMTDGGDDKYAQLEHIISLNLREITVHFSKHLPGESVATVSDAACSYVADRLHQSQLLCHLLFQLLDVNPFVETQDFDPYAFLNGLPLTAAKELFMLLERYFVAAEEVVFPLPHGFEAFFSVLAYKCMDIRSFLQYVDFGVVELNSSVLDCITTDATVVAKTSSSTIADDDNVMLEIISRLSRKTAMKFLQHLKCSTSSLLQVHNIVDGYLHQHNPSAYVEEESLEIINSVASTEDNSDSNAFGTLSMNLPSSIMDAMASFIRHLQNHGSNLKGNSSTLGSSSTPSTPRSSSITADLNLIKETQLNNIAKKNKPSSTPCYMTIRPPISSWR